MNQAYIFDSVRTPRGRGKKDGKLHSTRPVMLAKTVLQALKERNDLDTEKIEDVIFGCVTPVGEQGGNIAKTAAFAADYSDRVPGVTLNRFCSSGLEAINQAAASVRAGFSDLIVAGGVEAMSRIPLGSDGGAWVIDPEVANKTSFVPQGISADLIASLYGFSRQDCDAFAVQSQQRAAQAWREKRFDKSIVAVHSCAGEILLGHDEHMRAETTVESLAKLKPAFAVQGEQYGFDSVAIQKYPQLERINHVHHAGNSSGIVDGAAAVLIGSEKAGKEMNLKARAKIRSIGLVSTEPTIMLTGPAPATQLALKKAGLSIDDIDLIEVNEAFSSVVLNFMREMKISDEKVNVNGGAIAMGHPLGATGAIIMGTVLDELERRQLSLGLVTLCVGGGMGVATIIERV